MGYFRLTGTLVRQTVRLGTTGAVLAWFLA
jgi:hypothetical protein